MRSRVMVPARLTSPQRACWAAWAEQSPGLATPFLAVPYMVAAAQAFPAVRICVIERNGDPAAFLPFQFRTPWHQGLGAAERVGGALSDYFGLIAPPGFQITPARLLQLAGLHGLSFTHLDESQAGFGLTGDTPETGLRIDLSQGGAAYWAELKRHDKRFVADTERRERKLVEAHGPIRFTFRCPDARRELDHLIERKRAQYARTGADDALAEPRRRRFLQVLADSDDPLCRGVVSTLHAGETWVASHFGLMHRGTLHFWFPVYNRDLDSFSPGRLLMVAIIRQAEALGVTLIDRGVGDSQAKRDFANSSHLFSRGLWRRDTPQAAVIGLEEALRWRAAAWLRRRARRPSSPGTANTAPNQTNTSGGSRPDRRD